jgi:hypothetical protein
MSCSVVGAPVLLEPVVLVVDSPGVEPVPPEQLASATVTAAEATSMAGRRRVM